MNVKLARQLRKGVNYQPTEDRVELDDYLVTDTSEVIGFREAGVNMDGTPILRKVIAHKCTMRLPVDSKRATYQQLKREINA